MLLVFLFHLFCCSFFGWFQIPEWMTNPRTLQAECCSKSDSDYSFINKPMSSGSLQICEQMLTRARMRRKRPKFWVVTFYLWSKGCYFCKEKCMEVWKIHHAKKGQVLGWKQAYNKRKKNQQLAHCTAPVLPICCTTENVTFQTIAFHQTSSAVVLKCRILCDAVGGWSWSPAVFFFFFFFGCGVEVRSDGIMRWMASLKQI